ncbi:unnamed protein product [Ectocarpus fasciculatus]
MESAGDCEGVDAQVMRAWRTSYEDLKATRHLPGRLKISQTTNKWKDGEGNVQTPLVDMPFGTANRWKREIDAVDKCHDRECCDDEALIAVATAKHPPPPTTAVRQSPLKSLVQRARPTVGIASSSVRISPR